MFAIGILLKQFQAKSHRFYKIATAHKGFNPIWQTSCVAANGMHWELLLHTKNDCEGYRNKILLAQQELLLSSFNLLQELYGGETLPSPTKSIKKEVNVYLCGGFEAEIDEIVQLLKKHNRFSMVHQNNLCSLRKRIDIIYKECKDNCMMFQHEIYHILDCQGDLIDMICECLEIEAKSKNRSIIYCP